MKFITSPIKPNATLYSFRQPPVSGSLHREGLGLISRVRVEFVVDKVAVGQFFLQVCRCPSGNMDDDEEGRTGSAYF